LALLSKMAKKLPRHHFISTALSKQTVTDLLVLLSGLIVVT